MYTKLNNFRYYFFSIIYDLTLSGFYREKVRTLVNEINKSVSHRVMEIGIGTGITLPFYDQNKIIYGVDPSTAMLNQALIKASSMPEKKIELAEGGSMENAHKAADFDHVVFCSTLSVLQSPEKDLKEYIKYLPPNGCIHILNHFTPESRFHKVFDRIMTPVGKVLGFKNYFPLSSIIDPETMDYRYVMKGYWSIVQVRKK